MSASLSIRVPKTPIPEVLYKYYPPERIEIFETMQVRFSSPPELNDAFDSHYLVPNVQGAKGRTARRVWRSKIGILSLTERPDNHLMWVHYARNHSGFVLGFDARAAFFEENSRVLRKVVYQKGPNVLSEADIDVCFNKADDWEYEQEWRCVRLFEHSESRMIDIEPNLVAQIIFGSRMEPWQLTKIVWCATQLEMIPRVRFLRSLPSKTSWTMENQPQALSLCPHCDGDGVVWTEQQPLKANKN